MNLSITEVARRTGVPSSTLRYYDKLGLLRAACRKANGYRHYDERGLERLAFIGRAKRLGLDLNVIGELVALWDGDHCATVQARLRELVRDKRAETSARVSELTSFGADLDRALANLDAEPVAGPCGADCACTTATSQSPLAFSDGEADQDPPIACALSADAAADRQREWRALATRARRRRSVPGGASLAFGRDVDFAEVAALVERELDCCPFYDFGVEAGPAGVTLTVKAPAGAERMAAALVGIAP
jgi:MerR family copper efflux transcriptional regulator